MHSRLRRIVALDVVNRVAPDVVNHGGKWEQVRRF